MERHQRWDLKAMTSLSKREPGIELCGPQLLNAAKTGEAGFVVMKGAQVQ
jgi:hypothetical protein